MEDSCQKTKNKKRDLDREDWFSIDNEIIFNYAWLLGPHSIAIYTSLCCYGSEKQICWPSNKKMMISLGIGKNKIIESKKRLEFWNIIETRRVAKKCTNRYLIIDKNYWKEINEESLKQYCEVFNINFASLQDKLHQSSEQTSKKQNKKKKNKRKKINTSSTEKIKTYEKEKRFNEKPYELELTSDNMKGWRKITGIKDKTK